MQQSENTVTVTVTLGLEHTKAMEVYRNRRDYQREYMRQYRQGKRRSDNAKQG